MIVNEMGLGLLAQRMCCAAVKDNQSHGTIDSARNQSDPSTLGDNRDERLDDL